MQTIKARFGNLCLFTVVAYLTFCLCSLRKLGANTDYTSPETFANREIEAIRAETPPIIDGKLDDACWQNSAKTDGLIQFEPQRG